MAFIEKFLGNRVELPEDRRYHIAQGLWAKLQDKTIVFGMSEPALMLRGGVKDIDWLVPEGDTVQPGQSVVFAITGKIFYIEAPAGGAISFNEAVKADPSIVSADPYEDGWMFQVASPDADTTHMGFGTAEDYVARLKTSEGGMNPEGIKGGVSGMCKAVYGGITSQKIS